MAASKCAKASGFRASSSSTEPIASIFPVSSLIQMGSGVPQKRSRESAQSTFVRRNSPKRPSLMCAGSQWTCWLFSMTRSISAVVLMNHERRAYWMSGSLIFRQQKG